MTEKVIKSTNTLAEVEEKLFKYLSEHIGRSNRGVLAGNSVHIDRIFLTKEFPKVINYLHYRQVDVSTIREVGNRHNPELMSKVPEKKHNHTARDDILESIDELRWYYKNYLIAPRELPSDTKLQKN